jgi:O-methyltransferase
MHSILKILIKKSIKKILNQTGFEIHKKGISREFPKDFDDMCIEMIKSVKPFTMTSKERNFALIEAVKYIINHQVPGDIVECGVWKGGSMMIVAKTLMNLKNQEKEIYLFDTFEGMTKPNEFDIPASGAFDVSELYKKYRINDNSSDWCRAELDEVKNNVYSTGYKKDKLHFVKGKVENTLPQVVPEKISILRLDTDWYESTLHELIHLFPKLVKGGVLIIDDYGYWKGSKKAVDEYFAKNKTRILLNRIDETGRIGIKL